MKKPYWFFLFLVFSNTWLFGQEHSVVRQWNEVLLEAIRHDLARRTIHARNLIHVSAAMYDAWAIYDDVAETYLIGKQIQDFESLFYGVPNPDNVQSALEEAISY